jgi:hypothetical protein
VRRRAPHARLVLGLWGVRREDIEESAEASAGEEPVEPAAPPQLRSRPRFALGFWGLRREEVEAPVEAPPPAETIVTTLREFIVAIEEQPSETSLASSYPPVIPALSNKQ